jgi:hypothetical protein
MSIIETATDKAVEFIREALALITGGEDPAVAVETAKLQVGVTDDELRSADTGDVLQGLCEAPGASPLWAGYFDAVQNSYNGNGNYVVQGGGNSSGGSSGGSTGSATTTTAAAATTPAEQIVYNYNSYEQTINDQDNIFSGNFAGDISVDQSQTDIEGDGNVVTHGDGDTNAVTGDHSSGAQSHGGDAQSSSGDGAVQNTGLIIGDTNTGDNVAQVDGGADGAGFNFGSGDQVVSSGNDVYGDGIAGVTFGDATNVSHNDASEGGAVSGTGDASGHNTDSHNTDSHNTDSHNTDVDVTTVDVEVEAGHHDGGHDGGQDGGHDGGHIPVATDHHVHSDHAGGHSGTADHGSTAGHELADA